VTQLKSGPIHVGIVVGPHFCAFDTFGVYTVLGLPAVLGIRPDIHIHFVGKNLDEFSPVPPMPMRATTTYADCPQPLDVLAVGAMPPTFFADAEALAFIASAGARASYLIGVCAGALVLGAAGLLKGYKATTNFHDHHRLPLCGAIPVDQHVVVDRNRYTSGPVVGAFDAALLVLAELCGPDVAKEIELDIEHLAQPPFGVGSPALAGPELTRRAKERVKGLGGDLAGQLYHAACAERGLTPAAGG
jgi:transcriptional regulator GlxA family with amidase domain